MRAIRTRKNQSNLWIYPCRPHQLDSLNGDGTNAYCGLLAETDGWLGKYWEKAPFSRIHTASPHTLSQRARAEEGLYTLLFSVSTTEFIKCHCKPCPQVAALKSLRHCKYFSITLDCVDKIHAPGIRITELQNKRSALANTDAPQARTYSIGFLQCQVLYDLDCLLVR